MPVTGQNDIMFMPWMAHFINLGHFNIYAYLHDTFGDVVMHDPAVWAPYPYGFYACTSLWLEWLKTLGLVDLGAWDLAWNAAHPARLVFLFKAAYLPFDLAIVYLLYRTAGIRGAALWAWSPAAIYTPFMMGQNDIYATAFAVGGACAAARSLAAHSRHEPASGMALDRWAILCSVLLGVGALFKVYPLLLLPPLALLLTSQWRSRLLLTAIGGSIYLAAALPFVTTPAFVQGVLLNVEGTRALGGSALLQWTLPPFLTAYGLLLCAIAAAGDQRKPPPLAWTVSFTGLSLLFLLAPVPFYWLIWLTPFAVVLAVQQPRLFWSWLAIQLAFVFALFVQHRELGVALPIHLAGMFNVPALPAVLSLIHARLGLLFAAGTPLLSTLLLWASFLLLLTAGRQGGRRLVGDKLRLALIMGPVLMLALGLLVNLALSHNLVTYDKWAEWQQQELAAGELAVQQLAPEDRAGGAVSGLRLQIGGAVTDTVVKACLYRSPDLRQEPLVCAARSVNHQIEYRRLYFVFAQPVVLAAEDEPVVTLQAEGAEAAVTLLYAANPAAPNLQVAGNSTSGSLDLVTLHPLDVAQALEQLFSRNILGDAVLAGAMMLAALLILLFLAVLLCREPGVCAEANPSSDV